MPFLVLVVTALPWILFLTIVVVVARRGFGVREGRSADGAEVAQLRAEIARLEEAVAANEAEIAQLREANDFTTRLLSTRRAEREAPDKQPEK